jgi:glycosyltransferase involved in cell wall biosynthesis
MPELEVIVVDDASSDTTLEVASTAAADDSRIVVLHNERNRGAGMSRNRAISSARGEWIAYLDADDTWSPERLERMLAVADGADVISDDVHMVSTVHGSRISLTGTTAGSLLKRQGVRVSAPRQLTLLEFVEHDLGLLKPMIRRSFLKRHGLEHDARFRYTEDFALYFETLIRGARWIQLPRAYYWYRIHSNALTNDASVVMPVMIGQAQEMIERPAIAGDTALIEALKRRIRFARSFWAYWIVRDIVLNRRFAKLVRLLLEQPSTLLLAARVIIKHLYARVVRKSLRAVSRLSTTCLRRFVS